MHFDDLAVVAALEGLPNFVVGEFGAPEWNGDAVRFEFWFVETLDVQGCAEGGAVVAGGGLDEDAIEEVAAFDQAVAGTVQGDAAGEAKVFLAGLASEMAEDVKLAGLQDGLQGGGKVLVQLGYV